MALLLLHLAEYFTKAKNSPIIDEKKKLDWWQTAVIYQIYPRSFKDSNGDGVGDLKGKCYIIFNKKIMLNYQIFFLGIEEKAEYFKEIGVDCIWLSPIFKSPMADFGYDISDYNDIDSIFGTIDDFISLKKKLKSLGNILLYSMITLIECNLLSNLETLNISIFLNTIIY